LEEEVGKFSCSTVHGEDGDIKSCVRGTVGLRVSFVKSMSDLFGLGGMISGILIQKLVNYPHQANVIDTSNIGLEM
jgi:hypothetical protein